MKRSRFTEDQIIGVLKEAEAGVKTSDRLRKHGISEQTLYRWKAKYGGMTVSEARRLKVLEDDNRRLKHLVADLTLDNQALKAVVGNSGDDHGAASRGRVPAGELRTQPATRLRRDRLRAVDLVDTRARVEMM